MSYTSSWIHICIVLHMFVLNIELETKEIRLGDSIVWEKQQKEINYRQ